MACGVWSIQCKSLSSLMSHLPPYHFFHFIRIFFPRHWAMASNIVDENEDVPTFTLAWRDPDNNIGCEQTCQPTSKSNFRSWWSAKNEYFLCVAIAERFNNIDSLYRLGCGPFEIWSVEAWKRWRHSPIGWLLTHSVPSYLPSEIDSLRAAYVVRIFIIYKFE